MNFFTWFTSLFCPLPSQHGECYAPLPKQDDYERKDDDEHYERMIRQSSIDMSMFMY